MKLNYIISFLLGALAASLVMTISLEVYSQTELKEDLKELQEKAYIQGFRKARSYEIKDTTELNRLYPDTYYLEKYGKEM